LSSHYKVFKSTKGGYYSFKTKNDIPYRCFFTQKSGSENTLLNLKINSLVYAFDLVQIKNKTEKEKSFDPKINKTVGFILNKFFAKNPDSVLFYICDDNDQKAFKRQLSFTKWFKSNNVIEPKKSLITANIADLIYVGAILLNANPEKMKIESYFQKELKDVLSGEKTGFIEIID
jgi:hypothetical protein